MEAKSIDSSPQVASDAAHSNKVYWLPERQHCMAYDDRDMVDYKGVGRYRQLVTHCDVGDGDCRIDGWWRV